MRNVNVPTNSLFTLGLSENTTRHARNQNKMTKKMKRFHAHHTILLLTFAASLILWTSGVQTGNAIDYIQSGASTHKPASTSAPTVTLPLTGSKAIHANVTAFSPVECGSRWCTDHKTDNRPWIAISTALRNQYPKATKIYIYAYDKTYNIIPGAPATGTDLDIWKLSQDDAKEVGNHNLLVSIY